MHIKLGLISAGLAAVASASQSGSYPLNSQNQQVGKVFTHEYIQPNVEEVCFTVRPIASCDDQHVASYVKHQKVGLHCLNRSSPIAKQFQREADQGQSLPLESKSQDVQAYVEVPVRCTRIDSEEKRLRKETEKSAEQKIHIVQQQDGDESFLFEHKPWTSELEQQQEQEVQYQRHMSRKNKHQSKSHQSVEDSDDEDQVEESELDTMQQYGELINKPTTMHNILKMKDEHFDRFMYHLKFIAHQSRRSDKWQQQLDQVLPNVFSKVAKQFFETMLEKQTTTKQEKEELYEQYKEVAERVYAYAVKQALQMKQLNQITDKYQMHSENPQQQKEQQQYITNKIARNLWYKIQKELTPKQVEEVRQAAETVQQHKPQLDRMISDETLVALNKQQMKQLEKDLTKVLAAGLRMINHNTAGNQIQSEEYRKYHGEDYETEFQSQYPKLHEKLATITSRNQWSN